MQKPVMGDLVVTGLHELRIDYCDAGPFRGTLF